MEGQAVCLLGKWSTRALLNNHSFVQTAIRCISSSVMQWSARVGVVVVRFFQPVSLRTAAVGPWDDANSPRSVHWLAGHAGTRRRHVPGAGRQDGVHITSAAIKVAIISWRRIWRSIPVCGSSCTPVNLRAACTLSAGLRGPVSTGARAVSLASCSQL